MNHVCDQCGQPFSGVPWVSLHKGKYYFTCVLVCKETLERDLANTELHQRSLELGKYVFDGR